MKCLMSFQSLLLMSGLCTQAFPAGLSGHPSRTASHCYCNRLLPSNRGQAYRVLLNSIVFLPRKHSTHAQDADAYFGSDISKSQTCRDLSIGVT